MKGRKTMNWKKKLLALGLSLAMVLSLAACGGNTAALFYKTKQNMLGANIVVTEILS